MSDLRRLSRTSRRQNGCCTRGQILEAGGDDNWIRRRVADGTLRRLQPGVYAFASTPDSWFLRVTAAVLAAGPGAHASHATAARIHGLEHVGRLDGPIEVTVPRGREVRLRGIRVHTTTASGGVTTINGTCTATVERTLCHLAGRLDHALAERAVDHAVATKRTTFRALAEDVARAGRFRGAARIRRVLSLADPSVVATRSEIERAFTRFRRAYGLPAPEVDYAVVSAGVQRYLDFAYPQWRIAIEMDSDRDHGSTFARRRDGQRQNPLVLEGWLVLRFDLRDLRENPERVAAEIRAAIAQRTAASV